MIDTPITLDIFIRLITPEPLTKNETKKWFKTVQEYGPKDIISGKNMVRPNKMPGIVKLFHKKTEQGNHIYEIPLHRSMTAKEIHKIKKAWRSFYTENFKIEYSDIENYTSGDDPVIPSQNVDKFQRFCEQLAKHRHTLWIQNMVDNGWRYGLKFNKKNKTHPMMRPWEELPPKYKEVDTSLPKLFVDMLDKQGFSVEKK